MIYELLGASMRAELKAIERDLAHRMAWAASGAKSKRHREVDQSSPEGIRERERCMELRPATKIE
jgi:hypothetical protein